MGTGCGQRWGRRARATVPAIVLATMLAWGACASAVAGTLFGTLYRDGGLWPGAGLALACPGRPTASGGTDGRGAWRLTVPHSGACVLWVDGASMEVVVFDQPPTQVDLAWKAGPPPTLQRR